MSEHAYDDGLGVAMGPSERPTANGLLPTDKDLLPCPRCGGEAIEWSNGWPAESGRRTTAVACTRCDVHTGYYDDPDEARRRWGRRPGPAAAEGG